MNNDYFPFLATFKFGILAKTLLALNVILFIVLIFNYQLDSTYYKDEYLIYLLITSMVSLYLVYLHISRFNLNLDIAVKQIVEEGLDTTDIPLIIYLRPFITDGKLPIENHSLYDTILEFFLLGLNTIGGFESKLRSTLKNDFNLIRLDEENEDKSFLKYPLTHIRSLFSYRIGSYVAKESWHRLFEKIARESSFCLVVPPVSTESETCYETRYLIDNDLQSKTIFIMPRAHFKIGSLKKDKVSAKSLWRNLVSIINNKIILPEYNKSGGFVIYINGKYRLVEGVFGRRWYSRKAIKQIFKNGEITGSPWIDSFRVMIRLVWIMPILCFFMTFILFAGFSDYIPQTEETLVIVSLVILVILVIIGNLLEFYRFLKCFMLQKDQLIQIFIVALVTFAIGILIVEYVFNFASIGWLPPPPPEPDGTLASLLYHSHIFIIPSILVYCVFLYIFSKREKMTLTRSSKTTS